MRQTLLGAMQSSDPLTLEPEGYTSSLTNMIPVWSGGQEYLSSAASGGIAGSLASLISRMFIATNISAYPHNTTIAIAITGSL